MTSILLSTRESWHPYLAASIEGGSPLRTCDAGGQKRETRTFSLKRLVVFATAPINLALVTVRLESQVGGDA
jgi:hypothetical protein